MRIDQLLLEYININSEKFMKRWSSEGKPYAEKIMPTEEANPVNGFVEFLEEVDPTQNNKYVNWMITRYLRGDVKRLEDFPARIGPALEYYDRLKRKKKLDPEHNDINKIKDIEGLVQEYKQRADADDGEDVASKKERQKSMEQQLYDSDEAKLVHNDSEYKIVVPVSHRASCFFGKNTKWCTTSDRNEYYHNMYSEKGPLYIILHKPTNTRWQFHFASEQFMDEEDDQIDTADFFAEHPTVLKVLMKAEPEYATEIIENEVYLFAGSIVDSDGQAVAFSEAMGRNDDPAIMEKVVRMFFESKELPEIGIGHKRANSGIPVVSKSDRGSVYIILESWVDHEDFANDFDVTGNDRQISLKQAIGILEDVGSLESDFTDTPHFIDHHLSAKNTQLAILKAHELLDAAGEEYDDDADLAELLDEFPDELEGIETALQFAERDGHRMGVEAKLSDMIAQKIEQFATSYDAMTMFGRNSLSTDFRFGDPVHLVLTVHSFQQRVLDDDGMMEDLRYNGKWTDEEFLDNNDVGIDTHHLDYAEFDSEAANEVFPDMLEDYT